jgi:hypothetical protein
MSIDSRPLILSDPLFSPLFSLTVRPLCEDYPTDWPRRPSERNIDRAEPQAASLNSIWSFRIARAYDWFCLHEGDHYGKRQATGADLCIEDGGS